MSSSDHTTEAPENPQAAAQDWQRWHEHRVETVSSPYGPLSLTGTHWLADHPDGRIDGVPGRWKDAGAEVVLSAEEADGISVDGKPFVGEVALGPDRGAIPASRVSVGERRLVVLSREGLWAVRDFDPASDARSAFAGIEAGAYDPAWVLAGRFVPYEESRTVQVENADGRSRGLGLAGQVLFAHEGVEHALHVAVEEDGSLWAVLADAGSGKSSYRFRFLRPAAPEADGSVTVDFNRALLPPCAFADHFICPFPPPGNTLPFAVPVGELNKR
ncbi:hypothetical protein GCM10010329_70050 [Streptomyces spiroverticillatus]|uniref:DUF1684 domain-containing protein n=1 Tax=Streptomyces finlayi TaxID=67296 RepID=A0A919CC27_9ACTN|nr:DUF1684 domain-containing protein [Streptomyces finlayi]GHA36887.1 hypothetical protein GCM10010329_70050 [Streptomyces spiroverticillatus]GHD01745.1 hypothetical protein GCM10010334_47750 [Streptomyces finlayi]